MTGVLMVMRWRNPAEKVLWQYNNGHILRAEAEHEVTKLMTDAGVISRVFPTLPAEFQAHIAGTAPIS